MPPDRKPRSPLLAKTAAGVDEIATRSRRLTPALRRLLILIDGQRSITELAGLLGDSDVASQLDSLIAAGLIAAADASPPPQTTTAPAALPQRLQLARDLMTDSARRHLGVLAQPLLASIAAAGEARALRAISASWHMALRDSRNGRTEADQLLHALRELIEAD